jgi:hypothetical protein
MQDVLMPGAISALMAKSPLLPLVVFGQCPAVATYTIIHSIASAPDILFECEPHFSLQLSSLL